MKDKTFETEFKVRDYECDAQGIVNNANYMHYLEMTRHEFLAKHNIFLLECHKSGLDPVVSRAELRYKTPLKGGETAISSMTVERKGPKIIFNQIIKRKADLAVCCIAKIEIATLLNGQITRGEFFYEKLKSWFDGE